MSYIFLDLDGTLLESRPRLFRLFSHLVPESKLTFEQYWQQKRKKISHAEILARDFAWVPEQIREFEHRWLNLIEQPEWLSFDKPLPGVAEALGKLATRYTLYLVTARQMAAPVLEQIALLGWAPLFRDVLVTQGHLLNKNRSNKASLIRRALPSSTPSGWMVGDTGLDICTGQMLGLRTAAVLTGFLSQESLQPYKPDLIVPNLQVFAVTVL